MLSDAAVKLQEGLARLAGADDDERLLGMALIALHGALEEHFREQLAREIVAETESRPGWGDLVDLWQKHRVLSPEDRVLILRTNSKRNQIAHGEPFSLSRAEVERYAQFVQDFMEVRTRPSRRWSKVEDAVIWGDDDSGVGTTASQGWSPLQSPFWSALLSPLRSAQQSMQQAPMVEVGTIGRRLREHANWSAKMAVVATVALVTFWFWNSWQVSMGITAVILYLVHRQSWLRATYIYVGGLVYGFGTAVLGLATAVAFMAALLWPLSAGYWYLTGGSTELNLPKLFAPVNEQVDEGTEEAPVIEEDLGVETAVPTVASTPTPIIQIQVRGNSNVRAEPNTTATILTILTDGEVYDVLEMNSERTWYKIRLESGQEGWIGSSRVVEIGN
jgi:hypothetical protein